VNGELFMFLMHFDSSTNKYLCTAAAKDLFLLGPQQLLEDRTALFI
jgi:hypothetical protein